MGTRFEEPEPKRARGAGLVLVAVLALALVPGAAATAGAKKPKPKLPDLKVTSLTIPAEAVRGGAFQITDTVKNAGRKTAKKTTQVSYWLSEDTKLDSGDPYIRGGHDVGRLRKGKDFTTTSEVLTAAVTPTGEYYVIACADTGNVLKEKSEKNCRASAEQMTLKPKVLTPRGGAGIGS